LNGRGIEGSYSKGPQTPDEFYRRYQGLFDAMLDNPNFFGLCSTQLSEIRTTSIQQPP
jgi:hypothetical protein